MQKLIENHTKKLLDGNSSNAENPEGNPNLDKGKRQEIVKQMKDEVPVVLLNQWLEIQPEKSGFAKVDN